MKTIFAVTVLVLAAITLAGQSFEGKITYRNTYKSKMPNVKDSLFAKMLGSSQDYFIKGGNYKSVTNGNFFQWQLYINSENKIYSKTSNSETILWDDGALNKDSILKVQLNKGAKVVLGYKCDELILTCKNGIQKYYFNSKFPIDPTLFAKHAYGNWYGYLMNARAVPLKMIFEFEQFTLESTATEIKAIKLKDSEFQLPPNSKTEKNPF